MENIKRPTHWPWLPNWQGCATKYYD